MITFSLSANSNIKLSSSNEDIFRTIRDNFAVDNPAANYVTSPYAQSRFYSISPLGVFGSGLMKDVYSFAKTLVGKENISVEDEAIPHIIPSKCYISSIPNIEELYPINPEFKFTPEQKKAIHTAIKFGRAVVVSPTGSGKGFILFGIMNEIMKLIPNFSYILLTVPNVQLVHQLYDEAIKFGFSEHNVIRHYTRNRLTTSTEDIGRLSENGDIKIVITNRSFIQQPANFIPFIKGVQPCSVFVDEVHTIKKSTKFSRLITVLNTPNKYGFTGTVSPAKYDEYRMKSLIGPIVYEESITNLQEVGTLSKIQISKCVVRYDAKTLGDLGYYEMMRELKRKMRIGKVSKTEKLLQPHVEEFKMFYCAEWTKNLIRDIVLVLGKKNTLILYDNVEIGDELFSHLNRHLQNYGYTVRRIDGKTPVDVRLGIQKDFEIMDNQVLVAQTQTFSTGINNKNIHNIIFTFSSKSFVKIIQSIGRGLRVLEDKSFLRLIDVSSNLQYSSKHAKLRTEMYTENYGKSASQIITIPVNYNQPVQLNLGE